MRSCFPRTQGLRPPHQERGAAFRGQRGYGHLIRNEELLSVDTGVTATSSGTRKWLSFRGEEAQVPSRDSDSEWWKQILSDFLTVGRKVCVGSISLMRTRDLFHIDRVVTSTVHAHLQLLIWTLAERLTCKLHSFNQIFTRLLKKWSRRHGRHISFLLFRVILYFYTSSSLFFLLFSLLFSFLGGTQ
jgi:hypothetical protein